MIGMRASAIVPCLSLGSSCSLILNATVPGEVLELDLLCLFSRSVSLHLGTLPTILDSEID